MTCETGPYPAPAPGLRQEDNGQSGFLYGGLLVCGLLALFVLYLPDKRTQGYATRLAWILIAAAAVFDRRAPLRRRLSWSAGVAAFTLAAMAAWAAWHGTLAAVTGPMLRYQVPLLWFCFCWLASGALYVPASTGMGRRRAAIVVWPLALFAFCALASAFTAVNPRSAMKLAGSELLVYASLFVIVMRLCDSPPRVARHMVRAGWWICLAVGIAMVIVVVLHAAGGRASATLVTAGFIHVETNDPAGPWRLEFPFQHHNRAAFHCLCATFLLAAGPAAVAAPLLAAATGVAASVIALYFTLTRGAMLAALGGFAFTMPFLARRSRHCRAMLLLVPMLLAGGWFLLPLGHKEQIRQALRPSSYAASGSTTIGARLMLWQSTAQLIRERPLAGWGFGYECYEEILGRRYPDLLAQVGGSPHAHNMWLEIAAESGVPAAVLFLAFATACFATLLAGVLRMLRQPGSASPALLLMIAWLGLETAIFLYGLTNYPWRRTSGMFAWCLLAAGCGICLRVRDTQAGKHNDISLPDDGTQDGRVAM